MTTCRPIAFVTTCTPYLKDSHNFTPTARYGTNLLAKPNISLSDRAMLNCLSPCTMILAGGRVTGGNEPPAAVPSDGHRHAAVLPPVRHNTSAQAIEVDRCSS